MMNTKQLLVEAKKLRRQVAIENVKGFLEESSSFFYTGDIEDAVRELNVKDTKKVIPLLRKFNFVARCNMSTDIQIELLRRIGYLFSNVQEIVVLVNNKLIELHRVP